MAADGSKVNDEPDRNLGKVADAAAAGQGDKSLPAGLAGLQTANLEDIQQLNNQPSGAANAQLVQVEIADQQDSGIDVRKDYFTEQGSRGKQPINNGDLKPADKKPDVAEPVDAEKRLAALEDLEGIKHDVTQSNGDTRYRFYIMAGFGQKQYLMTTEANPERALQALENYRKQKMAEIEKNYNVTLSRDGEKSIGYDYDKSSYIPIDVRTPYIGELLAIEAGLASSSPSSTTKDNRPLRIDLDAHPASPQAGYYVRTDIEGKSRPPSIVLESTYSIWGFQTYKELVEHELAHNGQENYVPTEAERAAYGAALGFKQTPEGWVVEAADGSLYRQLWENGIRTRWYRVNGDGKFIDASGNLISRENAEQFTNQEIAARAKIHPATDYFPDPWEMGAEGMTMYRHSEQSRAELLSKNSVLYDRLKSLDQNEINHRYPLGADGQPSRLRSPDGTVVENNATNRDSIDRFENSHRVPVKPKEGFIKQSIFTFHGVIEKRPFPVPTYSSVNLNYPSALS